MRPENTEEAEQIAEYEEEEVRASEDMHDPPMTEDMAEKLRKEGLIGKESPLTFESQIRKITNEVSAMKIDPDDIEYDGLDDWEEGYNQALRNVVSRLEEWENSR